MKILKTILFSATILGLLTVYSCDDGGDDTKTERQIRTEQMTSFSGGYNATNVDVPDETATTSDDWTSFNVKFTSSQMTTTGHPQGASAVWPTGPWSFTDDSGTTFTSNGRNYNITSYANNGANLTVVTVVGNDVELGRIEALGGEYTFTLVAVQ